jgi:Right handed beta helix region
MDTQLSRRCTFTGHLARVTFWCAALMALLPASASANAACKFPTTTVRLDDFVAVEASRDISGALNTAIEHVAIGIPTLLIIPPGEYQVGSTIRMRSNIVIGAFGGTVRLVRAAGFNGPAAVLFSAGQLPLDGAGLVGVVIDGQAGGPHDAFSVVEVNDPHSTSRCFFFLNNEIRNFSRYGHALHVKGIDSVTVTGSTFANGGQGLIHSLYLLRSSDPTIRNNRFFGIGGTAIKVSGRNGGGAGGAIAHNLIVGATRGINVSDWTNLRVHGNTVVRANSIGVRIGAERKTSAQVIISRNFVTLSKDCLLVRGPRMTLTSNTIGVCDRAQP